MRLASPSRGPKRAAAVDLGKVRVGIAVADDLGLYAHPRANLDGKKRKALLSSLCELAREEGIDRFLVGLPLDMHGEHGPAARRAEEFAVELANASGVDVEMVDERLTTVEATRDLRASGVTGRKIREQVDGVAAAVLLQSWLDRRRSR